VYPDDRRVPYRLTSSLTGRRRGLEWKQSLRRQIETSGPTSATSPRIVAFGWLGAAAHAGARRSMPSPGVASSALHGWLLQLTAKRPWVRAGGRRGASANGKWPLALPTAATRFGPNRSKADQVHPGRSVRQGLRSEPGKAAIRRRLPRRVRRLPRRAHDARVLGARVQRGCVWVSLRRT